MRNSIGQILRSTVSSRGLRWRQHLYGMPPPWRHITPTKPHNQHRNETPHYSTLEITPHHYFVIKSCEDVSLIKRYQAYWLGVGILSNPDENLNPTRIPVYKYMNNRIPSCEIVDNERNTRTNRHASIHDKSKGWLKEHPNILRQELSCGSIKNRPQLEENT